VTHVRLFSEPFAKTGNIAAEGSRKLLGRPALGLLPTLIRESLQNVLDASHAGIGSRVLIRLRTLTESQHRALGETILAERPKGPASSKSIDSALESEELRVLEICDFGTDGLSGPTRADAPHDGNEPLNFINFMRNFGAGRDTHQGGGTYGYGKSSLYAMSRCATILVDSQTKCAGVAQRRFMACHLGVTFDSSVAGERRRFTGRHWWGVLDGVDSVEPVVDIAASELSASLGMPARDSGQTGTSILILDPEFSDQDGQSVGEDIIEAVLWNFWPRMVETTPANRRLHVELELEGVRVAIPKPEEFPPLDLFAAAMASHRSKSADLMEIRCERPVELLGRLAIKRGLRAARVGPAMRDGSVIPKQASHIALMRPVELVVKYLEGNPYPDARFDWAGVFICSGSDIVEEAFATSEPPAHDDWIPDNLPKGNQKTFVNVALKRLKEIARPQVGAANPSVTIADKKPSLAATASKLGRILGEVSSRGPGKPGPGPGGKAGRKAIRISSPIFERLSLSKEGIPIASFVAELQNDGSDPSLHLVAEPYLVVDGGATSADDLPEGYRLHVEQMTVANLTMSEDGPWIHVAEREGRVEVIVPTIPGAAIGLKLHLQSGRPA
jgi:hypothetical protein